jgi:hypothetical protein
MANLFGRNRKPEGPAWRESRGVRRRQGVGDVTNLPCARETAVEKEASEPRPNGNRRDARPEVERSARWFQRQGWKYANGSERMGKWRAGEEDAVPISGEKGRLCARQGVTASTGKKERPKVGLSKRVASAVRVEIRASV